MQTKELKTNNTMRTGMILAVIAIITLIALVMTFAKYASQGTGEDSARVAKWGLGSNIDTDLELFDASYLGTDSKVTVDSSDHANVIAPGTSKSRDITLATFEGNQAPEVMYHFEPSLTVNDEGTGGSLINELDNLPGWNWTLGVNNTGTVKDCKTVASLVAAVADLQESDIAPNTMPLTSSIQLGWRWDFESGYDASDTNLGNLIAEGNLSGLKVILNLNAYQCQGNCNYKPIQSILTDGTKTSTVNFLPAFEDGKAPCKFYKYDATTNGYTELDNSTMAKLGSAISSAGPQNVYTDAKGVTFYGTIDKNWNEAFNLPSSNSDTAAGLNSTFKSLIESAGAKTVYGDYVNGKWVNDGSHNWDANDTARSKHQQPDLNGVGYESFYGAYGTLLSFNRYAPWSSRVYDVSKEQSYCWVISVTGWYGNAWSSTFAVVLSKEF